MHVLGTAGHVDHGKSTLVERLTGIDPDRLAEEKKRGLTIDLGFAWLTLPSGREAGIVDVPGHERFVHNMLAGVGSIDATIFVVAANEGWKPQSEEHLAILDLLGARGGVVALTKCDLASSARLEETRLEIASRTNGTALDGAPIVPVSPVTGEGIDELLGAIDAMLERTPSATDLGRPRLFVDRSFSIKGAGTVVTGTLTRGRLSLEDEVEILPSGLRARVRGIQTHKHQRETADPGSRVALNLAGIDRAQISRGDAVVKAGAWRPTDLLDVEIRPVRGLDHPITGRGAYKLYLGSAEVDARLRPLDVDRIAPGEAAFARVSLSAPVVADAFDRFVIRDRGRQTTVAGGTVLDAHPHDRRLLAGQRRLRVEQLLRRRDVGRAGLLHVVVEERGVVPVGDLVWLAGSTPSAGPLRSFAASPRWLEDTTGRLCGALASFHEANPLVRGMPREDARAWTGIVDARLFAELVEALAGRVAAEGPLLRLESHRVDLSPAQRAERDALLARLDATGLSPPSLGELAHAFGGPLVNALVEAGELVQYAPGLALSRDRYEAAKRAVADAITGAGPLTASRLREVLGSSRKYVIPLLEHFDAQGFTRRNGDVRTLA